MFYKTLLGKTNEAFLKFKCIVLTSIYISEFQQWWKEKKNS